MYLERPRKWSLPSVDGLILEVNTDPSKTRCTLWSSCKKAQVLAGSHRPRGHDDRQQRGDGARERCAREARRRHRGEADLAYVRLSGCTNFGFSIRHDELLKCLLTLNMPFWQHFRSYTPASEEFLLLLCDIRWISFIRNLDGLVWKHLVPT